MRRFVKTLYLLMLSLCLGGAVSAADRVALIIGNSSYKSILPLDNPGSDARLMAETLSAAGFQTTLVLDGTQSDMKRAIADFGRDLRAAGSDATGLFYYAGHGVQSQGNNYLLPVDSAIRDEADLDLVAVEANWVVRQLDSARIANSIIILDACRNNPFEQLNGVLRDGLAEMNAPTGSFISYSTAPGAVSYDGVGSNSPFTTALAQLIPEPGLPIETLFKQVRVAVLEETDGAQTPWESSSMTTDFTFSAVSPEVTEARALWESVKSTSDSVQIILFLRAYPNSPFADEARALLIQLMDQEAEGSAPAASSAPAAEVAAAPAPVPEPIDESKAEAAFAAALSAGTAETFEAFLQDFPNSAFTEAAEAELAFLSERSAAATSEPEPEPEPEPSVNLADISIVFSDPLPGNDPNVSGLSLQALILGSPKFSPIEGLDEAAWKPLSCNNCHNWNQEELCAQGNFYISQSGQRALAKEHPYGGGFKAAVKSWARGGCR